MNKVEERIVAFHITKGGQFHNPGYLVFLGENKISHYTNDLFITHENLHKYKYRRGYDDGKDCILDLCTDENYERLEELYGITQNDLGEMIFIDGNGRPVGLKVEDSDIRVGTIEIDGSYDTIYACYLKDCNEKELGLIDKYEYYLHSEIQDYVKTQLEENYE